MTERRSWPLLEVFQELRGRAFPLGVDEYVLALRALTAGFGEGSRDDLLLVCQSLWAQSAEEAEQIADVLDAILPPRFNVESVPEGESRTDGPGGAQDDLASARHDAPARTDPVEEQPAASLDPGEQSDEDDEDPGPWTLTTWPAAGGEPGSADLQSSPRVWQLNPRFDFVGTLPVTKRQIGQAWRQYRRMSRAGQRIEFDVDATVTQLHREGILLEPILIPRRVNQARLLILEDVGGSMVPFRYVTRSLVEGARHVGLSRVDVRYFHDVPRGVVFRDEDQRNPVGLDEAIAPFANAGILVYSDAGAARGGFNETRVRHTAELLAVLRRHTTAIAWLNPVPRHRWAGTSAQAICELEYGAVPMFTLDHPGLADVIDVLRGRRN